MALSAKVPAKSVNKISEDVINGLMTYGHMTFGHRSNRHNHMVTWTFGHNIKRHRSFSHRMVIK